VLSISQSSMFNPKSAPHLWTLVSGLWTQDILPLSPFHLSLLSPRWWLVIGDWLMAVQGGGALPLGVYPPRNHPITQARFPSFS